MDRRAHGRLLESCGALGSLLAAVGACWLAFRWVAIGTVLIVGVLAAILVAVAREAYSRPRERRRREVEHAEQLAERTRRRKLGELEQENARLRREVGNLALPREGGR